MAILVFHLHILKKYLKFFLLYQLGIFRILKILLTLSLQLISKMVIRNSFNIDYLYVKLSYH